jgi:hypothetical protein
MNKQWSQFLWLLQSKTIKKRQEIVIDFSYVYCKVKKTRCLVLRWILGKPV